MITNKNVPSLIPRSIVFFLRLVPMSNNDIFLAKSTAQTNETVSVEGVEYPLVKLEISRTSHPYYTGKAKLVDTAGRIDKFKTKYAKFNKK